VDASYKDYSKESFSSVCDGLNETLVYIGKTGVINSITPGLEIEKVIHQGGTYTKQIDSACTYSYYLLDGEAILNGVSLIKDDFCIVCEADTIKLDVKTKAELFVIKTPTDVQYKRFIDRY